MLTLVWFVALVNMINFTDGMDGLAAGVSGIGLATFAVIAASLDRADPAILAASLAGAALAFLAYNFHPARVFMGDSGAMLLGFVIAGVAISGVLKTSAAVAVGLPLLVLAIPILDTSFVILKRLKHGLPVYGADRSHFHHRFFTIGWSQRRTVLALYAWCALMAAVALALRFVPYTDGHGDFRLAGTLGVAPPAWSPSRPASTWSTSSRSSSGAARRWSRSSASGAPGPGRRWPAARRSRGRPAGDLGVYREGRGASGPPSVGVSGAPGIRAWTMPSSPVSLTFPPRASVDSMSIALSRHAPHGDGQHVVHAGSCSSPSTASPTSELFWDPDFQVS